ncbi:HAD family hydrolase [Robertmurraya massiliosenegalensis]|uniref:HAD family hydrolase n=1 Tax=Robertmurraya TaxID=2837507 RepID=UPI0039A707A8
MIKCVAIDMDGTLLTKDHEITEENQKAIKAAQEKGVEVVIATGRSYPEAIYILKEAGIVCPVICANGAEVRSPEGDIVGNSPLEKAVAKRALKVLAESDIYVEFFTSKGIFTVDMEKGISLFKEYASKKHKQAEIEKIEAILQERMNFIKAVENADFIFEQEEYHIYKLLAFSFNAEELKKVEEKLKGMEGIALSSSGKENLEINGIEAQKGIALDTFTKEKGISLMDTMAIGDNYNDLSMFQRVGRAVAMGNADAYIQEQCHFVTTTNEESGVAKAIWDAIS